MRESEDLEQEIRVLSDCEMPAWRSGGRWSVPSLDAARDAEVPGPARMVCGSRRAIEASDIPSSMETGTTHSHSWRWRSIEECGDRPWKPGVRQWLHDRR